MGDGMGDANLSSECAAAGLHEGGGGRQLNGGPHGCLSYAGSQRDGPGKKNKQQNIKMTQSPSEGRQQLLEREFKIKGEGDIMQSHRTSSQHEE